MQSTAGGIPAHIPKSLVYDFDHYTAPETKNNPQISMARRRGVAPDCGAAGVAALKRRYNTDKLDKQSARSGRKFTKY